MARPVRETDLPPLVAEEREGKILLPDERRVGLHGIEGDPEDLRVRLFEIRGEVAEPAPFDRSAESPRFREEPEDDATPPIIGKMPDRPGVVRKGELWRLVPGGERERTRRPSEHDSYSAALAAAPRHVSSESS